MISDYILNKLGLPLPAPLLRGAFALGRLDELWLRAATRTGPLPERLLQTLRIDCSFAAGGETRVPLTGPVIAVANHPHGILDGIALCNLVQRIRSDVKVLGSSLLGGVPELRDLLIPVDVFSSAKAGSGNRTALRQAHKWLENGGILLTFPAGAVSRLGRGESRVTDPPWNSHFVSLALRTRARVAPMFIGGVNSPLFYLFSLLHNDLGSAMLARELMRQQGAKVVVRVGTPILPQSLMRFLDPADAARYIRFRTYVLGRKDHERPARLSVVRAIAAPAPEELLSRDIERLPTSALLYENGPYSVFLAHSHQIPNLLPELGRLRETAFRAAGEGTGHAVDTDRFDETYHHLIAWHKEKREVVGGYRIGLSDEILRRDGPQGFYSSTLFRFPPSWWQTVQPAVELGRSFIRLEHQRDYGALLALWRGIGAFLQRNPHYRFLFGPVSISGRYRSASKQVIETYLRPGENADGQIRPFTPTTCSSAVRREIEGQQLKLLTLDEIDDIVKDIEPGRAGLPVLLRHYVNLGGRILAFNKDKQFSSTVDGLLLLNLLQADRRRLTRFLGQGAVDAIVDFHQRDLKVSQEEPVFCL